VHRLIDRLAIRPALVTPSKREHHPGERQQDQPRDCIASVELPFRFGKWPAAHCTAPKNNGGTSARAGSVSWHANDMSAPRLSTAYLHVRSALCWVVEVATVMATSAKMNAADASNRHWPAPILGVAFRMAYLRPLGSRCGARF
jgi:hypothetical protein